MNKHIDQSELSGLVASLRGIDPKIAEAFIQQLFKEAEKELVVNKSVKMDGLGNFKIIKSGSSNRILFLGSSVKSSELKPGKALIGTDSLVNKPIEQPVQSSVVDTDNRIIDNTKEKREDTQTTEEDADKKPAVEPLSQPEASIPDRRGDDNTGEEEKKAVETKTEEAVVDKKNETISPSSIEPAPVIKSIIAEKVEPVNPVKREISVTEKEIPQENKKEKDTKKEKAAPVRRPTQRKSDIVDNDPYRYISEREELNDEEDSPTGKKRSSAVRIFTEIFVIFIIVSLGFVIYSKFVSSGNTGPSPDNFTELENKDTKNYSCIILTDSDVSLKYLAKAYYGNEAFWPYIYKANENIVDASFSINRNSIIRIPKLMVDLVGFNKGELNAKAKVLEEEILKSKN